MARSTRNMQHWHAGYYDEQKHGTAWERIKEALHRDWAQTKADFSKTEGQELDQDVDDTVKQAIGKDPIPPEGVPNPPDAGDIKKAKDLDLDDDDFVRNEVPIEYGYIAHIQYGDQFTDWNDDLERQLNSEWDENKTGKRFDEVKPYIRRGYEYRK